VQYFSRVNGERRRVQRADYPKVAQHPRALVMASGTAQKIS
jgi:hypothetical protein